MEYPGEIFRSMKISIAGSHLCIADTESVMTWKRENFIRKEYIQPGKLYVLAVVRLLFRFREFFFQIAFPFTGRLWDIPVFAKIFHDILIMYSIADQRQYRTNCNGKNNEYGNEKLQPMIFVFTNIPLKFVLWTIMMKVIFITKSRSRLFYT